MAVLFSVVLYLLMLGCVLDFSHFVSCDIIAFSCLVTCLSMISHCDISLNHPGNILRLENNMQYYVLTLPVPGTA